jgi:hypothetical protein
MAFPKSEHLKTISEAVRDGSLIDVSEVAKSKGLQCKAFLCASFWDKTLGRSEEKLAKVLSRFACIYNFLCDYQTYGHVHAPGLPFSTNTHESFCTGILEPHEDVGLALVIVAYRTENELKLVRSTGTSVEYGN